jgi:hypothetical protein
MDLAAGKQQVRRASDSPWLERSVQVGLIAYGVVHLLVTWLALQLAFGHSSQPANQYGALHELAQQPFGAALLWVVGVGFVALSGWQAIEAGWGHRQEDDPKRALKRVGSAGKAVIFLVIAISAFRIAVGVGSTSKSQAMTARLMSAPLGQLLVGLVGVLIIVVAIVQFKRGFTTSFTKELGPGATSGTSGSATVRLGQVGYIAKGVAFLVLGGLFVWAAVTYEPKKTGSLDAALGTLLDAGVGPWLLVLVALGIGCFGLYCLAWARYPDTST